METKREKEAADAEADDAEAEGDDKEAKEAKKEEEQFNEESFLKKWDEDNPPIEVPPEVIDDIDNDYEFPASEEN